MVELVPKGIGAPPPEPILPTGPRKETTGEKGQSSSYENRDTLKNQPDEDVFDYHAASQPAIVDATTAAIMPVGKAGIYESLSPAPDGRHVLVQIVHKPYSYATTYDRFPKEVEAWDGAEPPTSPRIPAASLPLADRVPIHGVPEGRAIFLACHRSGNSGLGGSAG